MKLFNLAIAIVATIGLTASIFAAEEERTPRRGIAKGGGLMERLLERFDKDGDGKLNEQERQAAMKARAEFMKRTGSVKRQGMLSRDELVKRFDKNRDGKIDDTERAAARGAMSKLRGQRGTGATVRSEVEARQPRVDKKDLLKRFDADRDGKLNDKERAKARDEFQNRKRS